MIINLCEERSMDINDSALKKRKREDVYEEQSGENMTIVSKKQRQRKISAMGKRKSQRQMLQELERELVVDRRCKKGTREGVVSKRTLFREKSRQKETKEEHDNRLKNEATCKRKMREKQNKQKHVHR